MALTNVKEEVSEEGWMATSDISLSYVFYHSGLLEESSSGLLYLFSPSTWAAIEKCMQCTIGQNDFGMASVTLFRNSGENIFVYHVTDQSSTKLQKICHSGWKVWVRVFGKCNTYIQSIIKEHSHSDVYSGVVTCMELFKNSLTSFSTSMSQHSKIQLYMVSNDHAEIDFLLNTASLPTRSMALAAKYAFIVESTGLISDITTFVLHQLEAMCKDDSMWVAPQKVIPVISPVAGNGSLPQEQHQWRDLSGSQDYNVGCNTSECGFLTTDIETCETNMDGLKVEDENIKLNNHLKQMEKDTFKDQQIRRTTDVGFQCFLQRYARKYHRMGRCSSFSFMLLVKCPLCPVTFKGAENRLLRLYNHVARVHETRKHDALLSIQAKYRYLLRYMEMRMKE